MLKRQFSTREKVLLVVLAILLLGCFYYLVVDRPVQDMELSASMRKAEAEATLEIREASLTRMRQMQQAIEERSASDAAEVPDYDNSKNVVRLLNTALAGTRNYSLSFPAVAFDGSIASRTVEMTFTCDNYQAAKSVLTALTEGPYSCRLTSLSMEAAGNAQQGDVKNGEVTVKAAVTFYEFSPLSGREAAAE